MSQPWRDPFEVLGLAQGASQDDVKRAFRALAMKCHPDRDPSPTAAARFAEVKRAADAILKGRHYYAGLETYDPVAAAAAEVRRNWQAAAEAGVDPAEFWHASRKKSGPLWFVAALMAGGIVLFCGTIWMHQFGWGNEKVGPATSYLPPNEELGDGRSSRRQELLEMVAEQRRQMALRREQAGQAQQQGHPGQQQAQQRGRPAA